MAKNFWVDIEDATGARLGSGPLRAHNFTLKKPLSAAGEFSFEVSIADPNRAVLQEKRTAICWYVDTLGVLRAFGGGIIDVIKIVVSEDGDLSYQVSGNDLGRELNYRSVGSLQLADESAGVTNGPALIMASAPSGWALTGGTTLQPVYASFDGESVLNALIRCGEHISEHWRLGAGREVVWLGPQSSFQSCGVRAIQHINDPVAAEGQENLAVISSLEEVRDAADVVTRIIPRGSGNGNAIVTLAAATEDPPAGYTLDKAGNFLRHDAAEALYGQIERVVDFKDLGPISNSDLDVQNAANMLLRASVAYLQKYSQPCQAFTLQLANANRLLESGTTMRVVYRKLMDGEPIYDLDGTFIITEVEQRIDENGVQTSAVQISNLDRQPMSDAEYLVNQAQSAKVFAAHPQLSASVDNIGFRDELDSSHAASFRFWLGLEYTTIQRTVLRFRVQPLRSTVKSSVAASGGGSSQTSESGGGYSITSGGGGGVTVTGGVHGHGNPYNPNSLGEHSHVLSNHTHSVSAPSHTHDVNIPNHSHNVSLTYGIFEESSANTLQIGDLAIKLNGGDDLSSNVADIGNGWYELDFTQWLVNEIYRPARENNEIEISTAAAKTGRVEAQLTIRGVVQAVAYL